MDKDSTYIWLALFYFFYRKACYTHTHTHTPVAPNCGPPIVEFSLECSPTMDARLEFSQDDHGLFLSTFVYVWVISNHGPTPTPKKVHGRKAVSNAFLWDLQSSGGPFNNCGRPRVVGVHDYVVTFLIRVHGRWCQHTRMHTHTHTHTHIHTHILITGASILIGRRKVTTFQPNKCSAYLFSGASCCASLLLLLDPPEDPKLNVTFSSSLCLWSWELVKNCEFCCLLNIK